MTRLDITNGQQKCDIDVGDVVLYFDETSRILSIASLAGWSELEAIELKISDALIQRGMIANADALGEKFPFELFEPTRIRLNSSLTANVID